MSLSRGIFLSGLLLSALLVITSCKKHTSPAATTDTNGLHTGALTGPLVLSAARVQLGQPLIATLEPTGVFPIRWTCPVISNMAYVTPAGKMAMYLFEQPGYYTIEAASLGVDIASVTDSSWLTVYVTDTIYEPAGPAQDTLSLLGDQVSLTPTVDSAGNLILLGQTKNTYGCLPSLVYSITTGSDGTGGIVIDLQEVVANGPNGCNVVENHASAYLFCPSPTSLWSPGDYPLVVTLNGVTYTGTITVTATDYSIKWSYTSGVTVTGSTIKK